MRREDPSRSAESCLRSLGPGLQRELTQFANRLHHLGTSPRLHPEAVLMVLHCRKARVRARQVRARAAPKPIAFAARPASRDRPRKRPKVAGRQPVKRYEKKEHTQALSDGLSTGICVVWQLNHRRPRAESELARKRAAVAILSAIGADACEHARQTPILLCVPRVVEGEQQNVIRVMANPEWKVDHARRKRAVLVHARLHRVRLRARE